MAFRRANEPYFRCQNAGIGAMGRVLTDFRWLLSKSKAHMGEFLYAISSQITLFSTFEQDSWPVSQHYKQMLDPRTSISLHHPTILHNCKSFQTVFQISSIAKNRAFPQHLKLSKRLEYTYYRWNQPHSRHQKLRKRLEYTYYRRHQNHPNHQKPPKRLERI